MAKELISITEESHKEFGNSMDKIRYELNNPTVVTAEFEDRTAIVNIRTGAYYSIWGEKPRKVFLALSDGANIEEIMEAFGPYSFRTIPQMRTDLENYIQQFLDFGIFRPSEQQDVKSKPKLHLLYAHLLIEQHLPTEEIIHVRPTNGGQKEHLVAGSQKIYSHLEARVKALINQDLTKFFFCNYELDKVVVQIGYGSADLKTFFHPAMVVNSNLSSKKIGLKIIVAQVDESSYNELRKLLNAKVEKGQENFSFSEKGLTYTIEQVNSEVIQKLVYWWDGTIRFYNKYSNTGYYICRNVHKIPKWEKSFSFRDLLNWHLQTTDYQLVHGAGIHWKGKGVLLTAEGGSGKSTTTLHCINQAMQTLGDDFLLLNVAVKAMYNTYSIAKFRPEGFEQFKQKDWLKSKAKYYQHNKKYHLNLADTFPKALLKASSLDYIMIPKITGKATARFERATKEDALTAILLSTLYLLPGNKSLICQKVKVIVEKVPCYFFYLSNDIATNPSALKAFLSAKLK